MATVVSLETINDMLKVNNSVNIMSNVYKIKNKVSDIFLKDCK